MFQLSYLCFNASFRANSEPSSKRFCVVERTVAQPLRPSAINPLSTSDLRTSYAIIFEHDITMLRHHGVNEKIFFLYLHICWIIIHNSAQIQYIVANGHTNALLSLRKYLHRQCQNHLNSSNQLLFQRRFYCAYIFDCRKYTIRQIMNAEITIS